MFTTNEVEEERAKVPTYKNSKGQYLTIADMETTHLINALAKLHKEIYKANDNDEWCIISKEISDIDLELLKRQHTYWSNRFGGKNAR